MPPLALLISLFGLAAMVTAWLLWREERSAMAMRLAQRRGARQTGSWKARLEHPWVDLSRCIGCASCVRACPEQGVLEILHGQAAVVHGARCIGHGECASHCPVGAIALTMADRRGREDLPAVDGELQAIGVPGLFLAGEVTGYALIRTAVDHGRRTARAAQRLVQRATAEMQGGQLDQSLLDLIVVGAGPAGLACTLEAKRLGLRSITLEQDRIGGTIARYPRRKLLNTRSLELPLGGHLEGRAYSKEELMQLWRRLCREHQLPIHEGVTLENIERDAEGLFTVSCQGRQYRSRAVVMAVGRRGIPNRLGVPGEELLKVQYSLIDANAYHHGEYLVVGGGDAAIETALGLAEQEGNRVHLSYRRGAFFRLRAANAERIAAAVARGKVRIHWNTRVIRIEAERVLLERLDSDGPRLAVPNDEVFVLAGGRPPFPLLRAAGVSFDPAHAPSAAPPEESGSGLWLPLCGTALAAALLGIWAWWHQDYYLAAPWQRHLHPDHALLRPAAGVGLLCGWAAFTLMLVNLGYSVRRRMPSRRGIGSLRQWMSLHVVSGLCAGLFATAHGGFRLGDGPGGHALLGMGLLILTGMIGRYLYSFLPRAANGRELSAEEAVERFHLNTEAWKSVHRDFGERCRQEIDASLDALRESNRWARPLQWLRAPLSLRRRLRALEREAHALGLPPSEWTPLAELARKAHRDTLAATHLGELRQWLAGWRHFHRWVGVLVLLLVLGHAWHAVRYADLGGRG